MSDTVAEAVAAVEGDRAESESPGFSEPDENESSKSDLTADHDVSDPDPGADELPPPDGGPSRGIVDRLMEPLQGSIREDRIGELWNPDDGGANRLVLVAEEAAGLSDGLPRAAHLLVGLGELYVNHADGLNLGADEPDEDDEDDTMTIDTSQL